jgi:hypothetical protein
MTQTTAPTITEDKKFAYAEYVVKNDAYMQNYTPLDFLTQILYAEAKNEEAYTNYREFLIDDLDQVQYELEIHFDNPRFIEAMEEDERFNFIWNAENDVAVALNDALQAAYKEEDFWLFEEICAEVFTNDEGTDAEACMNSIRENDEEGNGFGFVNIVYSYFNEGNADFTKAATTCLVRFASDIID